MIPRLLGLAGLSLLVTASALRAETVFIEAESLAQQGGWKLDTHFTHIVGSPYLLAHGLGRPVADATGTFRAPATGEYRVWVRTKDWVAPWNAPGTPGRFQVVINGRALETEFGNKGADWHWQDGGKVTLTAGEHRLALHDLTGFDGRVDAIVLTTDASAPPDAAQGLEKYRHGFINPNGPEDAGEFDLVVVGGGYGGLGTTLSAARQSLRVALIQDRPVLGGNGSSEIGVWAMGGTMRGKFPHLGEMIEEIGDRAPDSPGRVDSFADDLKERVVRAEKTVSLFLNHYATGVTMKDGRIASVTAIDTRTGRQRVFRGKFFADTTGHGHLGAAAGADLEIEPKGRMGMSNMWFYQDEATPQAWPATPWALPLEMGDFPTLQRSKSFLEDKPFYKAEWFWESGFDKDPIKDLELIRDWNLRAMYGAFSALKTGKDKDRYANAALKWASHVGGPRESRLLRGDIVLTGPDIVAKREFPDGTVPTTWDIDLHYPREQYAAKFPDNPFISRAAFGARGAEGKAAVDRRNGYPLPYRLFYSRNIPNLFMAGRHISVTHEALGTVRVMRTIGMMGEVVGKAAYLAVREGTTPRGVYEKHLAELLQLLEQPGRMRRDSLAASLRLDDSIADFKALPVGKMNRDLHGDGAPEKMGEHELALINKMPGVVVDDSDAKYTGKWTKGEGLPHYGIGYHYAGKGANTARFTLNVPKAGRYELRVHFASHENRSPNALVILERAGAKPVEKRIDQAHGELEKPTVIGAYDFTAGEHAVVLSAAGVKGNVHADLIQLVPVN
ncbi:MAG: FAD-dependent oxidoreductase [Verrucomicrobiota bacterium]